MGLAVSMLASRIRTLDYTVHYTYPFSECLAPAPGISYTGRARPSKHAHGAARISGAAGG